MIGVDLESSLRVAFERFRYTDFRPLQLEIVHAVFAGQDVFTGLLSGMESRTYQLPATLVLQATHLASRLDSGRSIHASL